MCRSRVGDPNSPLEMEVIVRLVIRREPDHNIMSVQNGNDCLISFFHCAYLSDTQTTHCAYSSDTQTQNLMHKLSSISPPPLPSNLIINPQYQYYHSAFHCVHVPVYSLQVMSSIAKMEDMCKQLKQRHMIKGSSFQQRIGQEDG